MGLGRATRGLRGRRWDLLLQGCRASGVYIPFMIIGHDFDEDMTLWVFGRSNWSRAVQSWHFSRGRL